MCIFNQPTTPQQNQKRAFPCLFEAIKNNQTMAELPKKSAPPPIQRQQSSKIALPQTVDQIDAALSKGRQGAPGIMSNHESAVMKKAKTLHGN